MALTDQQQAPAPTYGTYGLSGEQITNFINQNLGNAQAIADAAQQFGISAADIAAASGYTPQQQATYFSTAGVSQPGIAGLTPVTYGGDAGLTIKDVRDLVSANIQDPGVIARGMQQTGITEQDLGNIFQGIYTPEQISSYLSSPAAKLYATEYNEGASPLTAKESFDYIMANLGDPTRVSQAATSRGYTAQDLLDIGNIYAPEQNLTLEGLNEYLATGQAGYESAYQNIARDVFGGDIGISQLADSIYEEFQNQVTNNPTLTASQKQQLLSKTKDEVLASTYGSSLYEDKSLEDIEKLLIQSPANRYQEAVNLGNTLQRYLGYSNEQASEVARKANAGQPLNEAEQRIYDTLLAEGNITGQDYNDLLRYAAATNPDAPIFKDNPGLAKVYTPIDELINGRNQAGSYGYYNNAPILSAAVADDILAGNPFAGGESVGYGPASFKDDWLGWDLKSGYAGSILNGAGIFGVKSTVQDINEFDQIEREISRLGGLQTQYTDESGTPYVNVPVADSDGGSGIARTPVTQLFATDLGGESGFSNGLSRYNQYQSDRQALESGARQLGLNPADYGSFRELYEAVNDRTRDVYIVTGRANTWDKDLSEELGLTGHGQEKGGVNHAQVMYKKVDDKLVPVDILKTFSFDDPKSRGGFFQNVIDFAGSVLSMPPIQLALLMSGGLGNLLAEGAGYGASAGAGALGIDAAATGAFDIAGAANLGNGFALSNLANTVGTTLGSTMGLSGQASMLLGNVVTNAGLAALNTGLTGGDWDDILTAATSGGLGTGIAGITTGVLSNLETVNLSKNQINTLSNIVGGAASTAVTGQDPEDYVKNRVVGEGLSWLIDNGITTASKTTPMPKESKLVLRALAPIIMNQKIQPTDIINLAQALDKANVFESRSRA